MFCLNNIYFIFQIFYLKIFILFIFIHHYCLPIITLSSFQLRLPYQQPPPNPLHPAAHMGGSVVMRCGLGQMLATLKKTVTIRSSATIEGRRHLESFHVTNAKLSTNLKVMTIRVFIASTQTFWRDQREKRMKPIL